MTEAEYDDLQLKVATYEGLLRELKKLPNESKLLVQAMLSSLMTVADTASDSSDGKMMKVLNQYYEATDFAVS